VDFVGAQFYCPHALADGNQHIRIKENTLEFSTVLYAVSIPSALTCIMAIKQSLSLLLTIQAEDEVTDTRKLVEEKQKLLNDIERLRAENDSLKV